MEQSSLNDPPITIPEFQDQLKARAEHYSDEEIAVSDLSLSRRHPTPTLIRASLLNMLDDPEIPDDQKDGVTAIFPMEPHAIHLFCQRLKIPAVYFTRCMESVGTGGDRLDAHANHWLDQLPRTRKWFVRFDKYSGVQKIRGILTKRYEVYDHVEAIELLASYLPGINWTLSFLHTPTNLYADMRNPDMVRTICGKEIHGALRFKNSEVGGGSLSCELLTVNATDSTGVIMTGYQGFRRTHLKKKEEFENEFKFGVEALVDKMEACLDEVEATQSIKILDPKDFRDRVFDAFGLDVGQRKAVEEYWDPGITKTLFDAVQAIALAGALAEISMERKERLQQVAGEIIYNSARFGKWLQ
jgi:hypothetical protein